MLTMLCGSTSEGTDVTLQQFSPKELNCLEYAPLVSCEVERGFSQYKCMLAENRRKFIFVNLKYCMIVKCNEQSWN